MHGWGRYPRIQAERHRFDSRRRLKTLIRRPMHVIAHAEGRSYGDSALNDHVIATNHYNKFLDFNPRSGRLTCESGVTLGEIIDVFVPRGWFLQITPGTRQVSVGGALASDVHGKNHHRDGSFSECVHCFELMLPDGTVCRCSRSENRDLFEATCGGMGLTGIILSVSFDLLPIESAAVHQTVVTAPNLPEILELFETHRAAAYSVAWIDCLALGSRRGRAVLMLGEHARDRNLQLPVKRRISLPITLPGVLLNKYSVRFFNSLYYGHHAANAANRLVSLTDFFYPLDAMDHWNRFYGKSGFAQYQFVLPKAAGAEGLDRVLRQVGREGCGSFLAVLKLLGPANTNWLSFPMEGYTLALDFKMTPRAMALMDELDRVVVDFGGRLYLAKDVRMPPEVFQSGYRRWRKFVALRQAYGMSDKFQSVQSRRLGI